MAQLKICLLLGAVALIGTVSAAAPLQSVDIGSLTGAGKGFIVSTAAGGAIGQSSTLVDFDGDGNDDIAISDGNCVHVVFGPIVGDVQLPPLDASKGFTVEAIAMDSGQHISGGDLNGDKYGDLAIGSSSGFVAVLWGRRQRALTKFTQGDCWTITGITGENFGWSVRVVPSVNGDRIDDLVIGATSAQIAGNLRQVGAVYIVLGHEGTWQNVAISSVLPTGVVRVFGDPLKTGAGYDVAGCRDINGDGIGDIVYGSNLGGGACAVFGRNDSSWPQSAADFNGANGFTVRSTASNFVYTIDCGDVDGDRLSDVAVGSTSANLVVLFGHGGQWKRNVSVTKTDLDGLGGFVTSGVDKIFSARFTGDINGDRIDDLGIGSPHQNNLLGAAFVVFGHRRPWNTIVNLTELDSAASGIQIAGVSTGEMLGVSFANNPGSIDGDSRGLCDVMIGAPAYNSIGRLIVVFGNGSSTNQSMPAPDAKSSGEIASGVHPSEVNTISQSQSPSIHSSIHNPATASSTAHRVGSRSELESSNSPVSVHSRVTSALPEATVTSIIIKFEPEDMPASPEQLERDIAAALSVPVTSVIVHILSDAVVLVTIKSNNAMAAALELENLINNNQCVKA